jgi:hypothetical protein
MRFGDSGEKGDSSGAHPQSSVAGALERHWYPDWEPRLARARPAAQSVSVGSLEPHSLMLLDLWWTRDCSSNPIQWQWSFPAPGSVELSWVPNKPSSGWVFMAEFFVSIGRWSVLYGANKGSMWLWWEWKKNALLGRCNFSPEIPCRSIQDFRSPDNTHLCRWVRWHQYPLLPLWMPRPLWVKVKIR